MGNLCFFMKYRKRGLFIYGSLPEQDAAPGRLGLGGVEGTNVPLPPVKTVLLEVRTLTSPHLRPSIALSEFGKLACWGCVVQPQSKRIGFSHKIEKVRFFVFIAEW